MHIIIALDSSDDARRSISFLQKIPFAEKPKLTIVTALQADPYPFNRIPAAMVQQLRDAEVELARKNFEETVAEIGHLCASIDQVAERKQPSELILEVARDRKADLVVVGARGHSAIYRVLLGSTADHVVNAAKCSVLVVRQPEESTEAQSKIMRVLLAYDGSPHSAVALAQLKLLDWQQTKSSIHIAMKLERPGMLPDTVIYDADVMAESEKMLKQVVVDLGKDCDVTQSVGETYHVGNSLSSQVENDGFDLLFVGASASSSLSRMLLGSTSRYLLHHAKCSIWIARGNQW